MSKRAQKILLVDDDVSGRAMMRLSLRQAGHQVMTAADGPEALALLKEGACDVMITDARMKPMDGFELAVAARRIKPKLRIAMISALCTESDINGYPIDKLFPKPVTLEPVLAWLAA